MAMLASTSSHPSHDEDVVAAWRETELCGDVIRCGEIVIWDAQMTHAQLPQPGIGREGFTHGEFSNRYEVVAMSQP
jgi:hypothetical protein